MEGREGGGRKRGRKGVREQRRHFASGGSIVFFQAPESIQKFCKTFKVKALSSPGQTFSSLILVSHSIYP